MKNLIKKEKKNEKGKTTFEILPEINERKRITYLIIFLIVFIFEFIGLQNLIVMKFGIQFSTNMKCIINTSTSIITVIILLITLKETLKRDSKYFTKSSKKYIKYALSVFVVCCFFQMVVGAIINIIVGAESANSVYTDKLPIWYKLTQAALFAPFVEECLFRGLLKKIIKNKYAFLIISSVFFGAMHIIIVTNNPLQYLYIIPYSIGGFAFAYNYEKTGNLTSSIVLHMIVNTIAALA